MTRTEAINLNTDLGESMKQAILAEPTHCCGSAYYCDPQSWGCDCACEACTAARAL